MTCTDDYHNYVGRYMFAKIWLLGKFYRLLICRDLLRVTIKKIVSKLIIK